MPLKYIACTICGMTKSKGEEVSVVDGIWSCEKGLLDSLKPLLNNYSKEKVEHQSSSKLHRGSKLLLDDKLNILKNSERTLGKLFFSLTVLYAPSITMFIRYYIIVKTTIKSVHCLSATSTHSTINYPDNNQLMYSLYLRFNESIQ